MAGDQSSNLTGVFMAEETSLGVLPANPVFREREPNSYADFGGNYAMTTRKPITHDRQFTKGEVSDNNPSGGWNEDFTPTNMIRPMQGFLFADAYEKPSTAPLNAAQIPVTAVTLTSYSAASGLAAFGANTLVLASGFGVAANNGLKLVTASTANSLTVSGLAAEASPPAGARIDAVGHQFASADLAISILNNQVVLTSTAGGINALGLKPGEFIGVGGDTSASRFGDAGNNAPFYGRVAAVTNTTITLDKTTGVQATNAGTAKTIQIFFGTFVRNEDDCENIKLRSWTIERQYGCGAGVASATGIQGAAPNQLTITVPEPGEDAKVTCDLAFIAATSYDRTEAEGPMTEDVGASVVNALNEPAFAPGLNVYSHKLAVIDDLTLNPTALVAFNSDASLVINNNLAGNKAIEVFGFSGMNIGEFSVTGTLNAYFQGVEAVRAVRQGADCTYHLILTKANAAVCFDIASLGLGGARPSVEANTPIKIPLDTAAGRGKYGYTLGVSFLRYAPTVLMQQTQI